MPPIVQKGKKKKTQINEVKTFVVEKKIDTGKKRKKERNINRL